MVRVDMLGPCDWVMELPITKIGHRLTGLARRKYDHGEGEQVSTGPPDRGAQFAFGAEAGKV